MIPNINQVQGRSCPLSPYTPESWEEQVSCGPSLPLTSCTGLAAPSSARSAFQESSGQAAPMGTVAGRAERECILSPEAVSSLPALIHFPGWPASQKPMGRQSSASSLAEVCVPPRPPVTLDCRASGNSARTQWSWSHLKPQQGCRAVLSWDSWMRGGERGRG